MGINRFVLSEECKKILEAKGFDLVCCRCGEELMVGDGVVSRSCGVRHYYHLECWEGMFVEVSIPS